MKKIKTFILLLCLLVPWCFAACENTNKTTLKAPTNISVENGVISFDYDEKIDYYTISIDDNYAFVVDAKQNANVSILDNRVNYDATKLLSVGQTYTIKIKASAEGKNDSKYSQPIHYIFSPVATKPQNVRTNGAVLTWDPAENASYYIVRVVTPNETILFDVEGNIIETITSTSIAKANIAEYSFNSNQFDFSSLLNKAGNYDFYVCSVISEGSEYIVSDYSSKTTYKHIVTLNTPIVGSVAKVNDELHLNVVIDENTNAINIYCQNLNKQAELNGSEKSIAVTDNMLDVNLNSYFADYVNSNRLSFDAINLQFSVQACYAGANNFYNDSNLSNVVEYENYVKLATPKDFKVTHNQDKDYYIASWDIEDENTNGFKLIALSTTGATYFNLDKSARSLVLDENFVAIYLQAIGKDKYANSNFLSYPSGNNTLTVNINNSTLYWNDILDAYYILISGGEFKILDTNSYTLNLSELNDKNNDFHVAAITNSKIYKDFSLGDFALAAPSIGSGQGFGTSSTNLYELTFTGSDKAIGYRVRIKEAEADDSEYVTLNNIYTTTKIDLSQYFASDTDYKNYVVQLQAVADKYSMFNIDSSWSQEIEVSHIQVLKTPSFYSADGIHSTPITKELIGDVEHYILKFYGVTGASSYEVLIGGSRLIIPLNQTNDLYEYDITNYMTSAKQYPIKLRALKYESAVNMRDSEYAVDNSFVLYKQLETVSNIQITENDGVITVSFDQPNNAGSYRVRIVKYNDNSYSEFLSDANLPNPFVITSSADITQYLKLKGVYYLYITALPAYDYYTPSKEVDGRYQKDYHSLNAPTNILFTNVSEDTYTLSWNGDTNADYYRVKITDANNFDYQFNVYGTTTTNINKYLTKQGTYTAYVYSMVSPTSSSSSQYSSSQFGSASLQYVYQRKIDFARAKASVYGSTFNHVVTNVQELKNLLWYYYIYGIDFETYLAMYVEARDGETMRDAIVRLANEADSLSLFPFKSNSEWLQMLENNAPDNTLFTTICKNLINLYPELNVLDSFVLIHTTGPVFRLYYENRLDSNKVETGETSTLFSEDYGYRFTYLDNFNRRGSAAIFAIDSKEEQPVQTTEQLLQAVQFGKKPKFTSGSNLARTVYANARTVLTAINSNEMSNVEKATNIFNWLEYALTLNYSADSNIVAGNLQKCDIEVYGIRKEFYLEGLFENLTNESNGNFDGEFYLGDRKATSELYAKAFTLLCSIEGIDSVVVNGVTSTGEKHVWNKVLLQTDTNSTEKTWYTLDLKYSDNRIYGNNINQNYEMSSHIYFLTSDAFIQNNLHLTENLDIISKEFSLSHASETSYNYYASSQIGLTRQQILSVATGVGRDATDYSYSNEYSPSQNYQYYAQTSTGYGNLQNYLLNQILFAEYQRSLSERNTTKFEFRFYWEDNGGSSILSTSILQDVIIDASQLYSMPIVLVTEPNGTIYKVDDPSTNSSIVVVTLKAAN